MLKDFLSQDAGRRTQLVLMPSATDVTCHPVFPQWPLQPSQHVGSDFFRDPDVRRRVSVVPNPATFVVGGVVVGGTSTDVLFQLNAHDAMRNAPGGAKVEKIPRMASHLLEQRSYYPLFPAPDAADTPLELTQLPAAGMPVSPDVLLLPSKLRQFTKALPSGTLVVNPGMLCRANSGGTFARLQLFPPTRGTMVTRESTGAAAHDVGANVAPSCAVARARALTAAPAPPAVPLPSCRPLDAQRMCHPRWSRRAIWLRASPRATPFTASRSARALR